MGIVKKQSFKKSILRYLGVLIGMLNMLLIYPLGGEMFGEIQFIINTASLFVSFILLGVNSWAIRFFNHFQNEENGHNGFLGLLLLAAFVSMAIMGGSLYLFKDQLIDSLATFLDKEPTALRENAIYISIICVLLCFAAIFTPYISNFNRIVIPDFLNTFSLKLSFPILILLSVYGWLSDLEIKLLLVLLYILIALALLFYIYYLGQLKIKINFSFLNKTLVKQMATYAFFGIIGSLGAVLAVRIDSFMVTTLTEGKYNSNWIYTFAVYVINVILIPYVAFISIGAPIIAKAMNRKNIAEVLETYQRSSLVLMIAGLGLFFATWISVDQLFLLSNKLEEVKGAKYVIFFLGLGQIVEMITGLNGHIIAYSKYYRFNVLAILILGIINVYTNRYFIPIYGITGAAIATCISLSSFNIIKLLFVWIKFGIQPFKWTSVQVVIFVAIAFALAYIIPYTKIPLLDIALHSGVFVVVFAAMVLYFKTSKDVNDFYSLIIGRIKNLIP